jgi:nucleoid-associated protein YgaU
MNKSKLLVLFILIVSAAFVFAQTEPVPQSILNNQYYLESVRLTERAKAAYELGDYDTAAALAEQAAEQARRSDAYVTRRLAENVLAKAHSRYTWAGSIGADTRFPNEYQNATEAYNEAVGARNARDWEVVTDAANRVLAALAGISGGPAAGTSGTYTVRDWKTTGDCFWNIAAMPAIYGDPYQWRKLYDANKGKLPDPQNPNWVEEGTVLTVPRP